MLILPKRAIDALKAHTHVTETVYRHVIVPAIRGGATVMNSVFGEQNGQLGMGWIMAGTLTQLPLPVLPADAVEIAPGVGLVTRSAGVLHGRARPRAGSVRRRVRPPAPGRAVPAVAGSYFRSVSRTTVATSLAP